MGKTDTPLACALCAHFAWSYVISVKVFFISWFLRKNNNSTTSQQWTLYSRYFVIVIICFKTICPLFFDGFVEAIWSVSRPVFPIRFCYCYACRLLTAYFLSTLSNYYSISALIICVATSLLIWWRKKSSNFLSIRTSLLILKFPKIIVQWSHFVGLVYFCTILVRSFEMGAFIAIVLIASCAHDADQCA